MVWSQSHAPTNFHEWGMQYKNMNTWQEYQYEYENIKSSKFNIWISNMRFVLLQSMTVTRIKQERTKIVPFVDFILHFSTFLLEILNIASQFTTELWSYAINFKSTNWKMEEKFKEMTNLGHILIRKDQDWSFLRSSPTPYNIFTSHFEHVSQLSCVAMLKISSKNIEKCRRKSKKGPILVLPWLVISCFIFVTVTLSWI